jgi:hypothetical protein
MSDLISRKAILKNIKNTRQGAQMMDDIRRASIIMNGMDLCGEAVRNQPSAQPEQQHGRIFQEIVVEYPSISTYPEYKGKPYFSIKYTENGQEFIGYGTYKPEVLSEFLKEYFMPSAQPQITHCAECIHWKHSDVRKNYCEVFDWMNKAEDFCSFAERRSDGN